MSDKILLISDGFIIGIFSTVAEANKATGTSKDYIQQSLANHQEFIYSKDYFGW